jgi:hypothetical protein
MKSARGKQGEGQRLTLTIICVWTGLWRGCSRGSSPVMEKMSSVISSSVSFNEKLPKSPAFPRRGRRLCRGIVPSKFSKVGAPFGPLIRGWEVLDFGAMAHSACTMICGSEDMVGGDEQGCNAGLNWLEKMVSKDAMVWVKWKEGEDRHM